MKTDRCWRGLFNLFLLLAQTWLFIGIASADIPPRPGYVAFNGNGIEVYLLAVLIWPYIGPLVTFAVLVSFVAWIIYGLV